MNRRQAKKLIQYEISDVIDFLAVGYEASGKGDDEKLQKNIDKLLDLYDQLIPKVSEAKLIKEAGARKKHFKGVFEQLDSSIEAILKTKK